MEDARYTDKDEANAKEAAEVLNKYAGAMTKFMQPHGIATAFLSVAVAYAVKHLPAPEAAQWLRGIADEVEERHGDCLQDNWPIH